MKVDYRSYKYNIAIPPFEKNHFINTELIPYWRLFWKQLLAEINSDEGLREDELHWQNRLTYITHGKRIVALHFIACYAMSDFATSPYAKRYLPQKLAKTYQQQQGYINTLQYLNVDPSYSHRKSKISFASVLMDISRLHQRELRAQKTITVARKSVGAHNLARKFGFTECCVGTKHNVDVSIMQTEHPKRHPKQSIKEISDYLWENKNLIQEGELVT